MFKPEGFLLSGFFVCRVANQYWRVFIRHAVERLLDDVGFAVVLLDPYRLPAIRRQMSSEIGFLGVFQSAFDLSCGGASREKRYITMVIARTIAYVPKIS